MTAARGSHNYRGNTRRGGLAVPLHTHPLVRRFFAVVNARRATLAEVAAATNVGVDTLRFWRSRHMPRLDLFDAALNCLGFELSIQRRRNAARRCLVANLGLTTRQQKVLSFIQQEIARNAQAPTLREIAVGVGVRLSYVGRILEQLKERGAIDYMPRRARSIVVLGQAITPPSGLDAGLAARLARYCAAQGEDRDAVVADAITLHLDAMEREHAMEAERLVASGGGT